MQMNSNGDIVLTAREGDAWPSPALDLKVRKLTAGCLLPLAGRWRSTTSCDSGGRRWSREWIKRAS